MNDQPVKIERSNDESIRIEWSQGESREYDVKELRKNCPCAQCQEIHGPAPALPPGSLPILTQAETLPLRIESMQPVGQYAYKIQFSDKHDLGIYTFDILKRLGKRVE